MLRALKVLCLLLLSLAIAAPAEAVVGATDRTAAASLLVPFFETGIDSAVNPHDTLLVVTNWLFADPIIHFHVWDIDGNPTDLQGNITLAALSSWSAAMRDLLNTSTPAVRAQLTEGAFCRGFVTIDVVTAATALNPREAGYPFSATNALEGFIYYTRLSQGSANGLAMVAVESVPATTDSFMTGFYSGSDDREEIDSTARFCAQRLTTGLTCDTGADDGDINRVHLRILAASIGRCNKPAEHLRWFHPIQSLSRAVVELSGDGIEVGLGVGGQIGAGWKVLTKQAISVLIASALPGAVRVAEVDVDVGVDGELHVFSHLAALVPGKGAAKLRRELGELARERVSHKFGGATVGKVQ